MRSAISPRLAIRIFLNMSFAEFAATAPPPDLGCCTAAVERLLAVRPHARLMTGSAAQRDILELTLIAAALRDGQRSFARGLLEPRQERKPGSAQIRRDLARCAVR